MPNALYKQAGVISAETVDDGRPQDIVARWIEVPTMSGREEGGGSGYICEE